MRGNQARIKITDVRHPSPTVLMHRRKSASPVHNVLIHSMRAQKDYTFLYLMFIINLMFKNQTVAIILQFY